MAELEADPDFVARRDGRNRERERRRSERIRAEAPVVEALNGVGVVVESVWDLVNTATPYPDALPVLLAHLQRDYPDRVREGIARALAVRDARFGWDRLIRLYQDEPSGTDTKIGLAAALAAAADREVIGDVITLAQDAKHGQSRLLLLRALKRSKAPEARAALAELEDDPELTGEVRHLLKRR